MLFKAFSIYWRLTSMKVSHSTSSQMYSQSLQQRLYQLLLFLIPISFSFILFLMFYLFCLKKSPNLASNPQPTLPINSNQAPFNSFGKFFSKGKFKDKLEVVLFNDDSDSSCCVCLGEFKKGEKLYRIATCKHVFHIDCICFWIHSNPTCPLCRCFIVVTTKHSCISRSIYGPPNPIRQLGNRNSLLAVSSELANIL